MALPRVQLRFDSFSSPLPSLRRSAAVLFPAQDGNHTHLSDEQLVQKLNQEGVKTNKGNAFTVSGIRWIRHTHAIPAANLKHAEELTVQEVAAHFGVSSHVVYYWIERHHIRARKPTSHSGAPWFLTIDPETEHRLQQWVTQSSRIAKVPTSQRSIEGEAL